MANFVFIRAINFKNNSLINQEEAQGFFEINKGKIKITEEVFQVEIKQINLNLPIDYTINNH